MIEIQIHGIDEIIQTLNRIAQKTENKQDLMADIAETMRLAVDKNFEEEGRPAWLGLKYPNKSGNILQGESGDLRSGITAESNNNQAIVGSNKVYAAIHQFGGMAGRGRKVKIPARPFLQLTEQDEADILEDVQDYWQKLLG